MGWEVSDDSGGEIAAQLQRWQSGAEPTPKGVQVKRREARIRTCSVVTMLSRLFRHATKTGDHRFPTDRYLREVSEWWTGQ